MTLFLCKKHGTQGSIDVCEHIDSELRAGVFREHKPLTFWSNVYACNSCWQNFEIDRFENHPELKGKEYLELDDDFDENSLVLEGYYKVYTQLNRNLWCAECVAETQIKSEQSQ